MSTNKNMMDTSNSGNTGSGAFAGVISTTLVTPNIGVATGTSISLSSSAGIIGVSDGTSASSTYVGEMITATASSVAAATGTTVNVTSVSLTAGDWDVWGIVFTAPDVTTTTSSLLSSISTSSAAFPSYYTKVAYTTAAGLAVGLPAQGIVVRTSGTSTVYLVGNVGYSVSTMTLAGTIYARRRR